MSAKFDKANLSNAGDWLRADGAAMAPSVPFSVSLWVFFENHVTGDPETIWFFGDKDRTHVVLHSRAA